MDNRLREALERRGLKKDATDRESLDFYEALSLEDKGRLGVELGLEVQTLPANDLDVREAAIENRLTGTREFLLRAETVNEEERSVEAVISTESQVEVWDWRRGETIDEILLADSARMPAQMPLLANHDRWSLDSVLGSIRNLRADGGAIVGRLFFARGDEEADKAWNKVRQGHLKDVSVGYRISEAIEVAPGETAVVNGRSYTAGGRALRIATNWQPKEGSLVPIGADQAAKIRQAIFIHQPKEGHDMPPKLRSYLETIGLRKEADDAEAKSFYERLKPDDKARADAAAKEERTDPPAQPPAPAPAPAPQSSGEAGTDANPRAIADQAVASERDRVRELRQLAGDDVPDEILARAIDEGWTVDRASREFLAGVRERRGTPAGPAIHVRDHASECNARSLSAGLLVSQGMDPTKHRSHDGDRRGKAFTEQEADLGDRFCRMSAADVVRECARIDTGRFFHDPKDAFRAAVSGGTLSYVFSTNVYARLTAGWETIGDTTVGWCDEEDVANFLTQEDISLEAKARLEKLARGDTAKDATVSDSHETYKIARYAKKFAVDEQDVIDDRLGAIMRIPGQMGEAARALRPDLVYALMLNNPTLVADSGAVFNATAVTTAGGHANLGTAALANDSLKAAITAMVQQRIGRTTSDPGRVLGLRPRFLIVPAALEWTARGLTSAAALAKLFADSSDPWYAALNLIAQEGIRVVSDDRIGAIGVLDPNTGTAVTGLDTNWFLTAGGSRGLRVAYRRGTNRQPVMRSYVLDRGQWGVGWDINLDIGAAFMDYRPWYKSTGAA